MDMGRLVESLFLVIVDSHASYRNNSGTMLNAKFTGGHPVPSAANHML